MVDLPVTIPGPCATFRRSNRGLRRRPAFARLPGIYLDFAPRVGRVSPGSLMKMLVFGGSGQVGPRLAEELGFSAVTVITKLTIDGNKATVERDIEGDLEIVEVSLPLLVTCQQGLNEPRYPSLPGIMKAKKKPLETLDLDDLDLDEEDVEAKVRSAGIFLPPAKAAGKVLNGDIEQQVNELLSLLKTEAKVI